MEEMILLLKRWIIRGYMLPDCHCPEIDPEVFLAGAMPAPCGLRTQHVAIKRRGPLNDWNPPLEVLDRLVAAGIFAASAVACLRD